MSATMEHNPPRIITVEEYHRMAEAGFFKPNSRVELIEGEIIDMAPIGISHNCVVDRLTERLILAVAKRAGLRVQGSFRLSNITEPQPDIILLKRREDFYARKVAAGEDTLLVIEVSDTTFSFDRNRKLPLYARYGIPEVWIVELDGGRLHLFRSLESGSYTDATVTSDPAVILLPGLDGLSADLSGLLEM